ncbi:hypothetical protein NZL82_10895 [Sphingomonas sanguinis]|uniref:hypothetical protein n=1 Tax=Sphingomonas sp. LC-1 TaxID=3110957 RepID=UPI0021BAE1BD|nr:hypothetical protein [Sphingomonas sp. LC-1]MCT8002384.1 hypothetical protein [Sphingomonas sp. LC-1]
MRNLSRRLAVMERHPSNRPIKRVVIVFVGQPVPPNSDDIHIIYVVKANKQPGTGANAMEQKHDFAEGTAA